MKSLDKENLHKEIDLIQACISRMASNSFFLKGWAISIVAVVLALAEKDVNPFFLCLVVLVPLLSFWYLDAFFLLTEKMYREMYKWVISERPKSNSDNMYDLNPHRFKDLKDSKGKLITQWRVMWSVTLRFFYGVPIILVVIIIGILFFNGDSEDVDSFPVIKTENISNQSSEKAFLEEPVIILEASSTLSEDIPSELNSDRNLQDKEPE